MKRLLCMVLTAVMLLGLLPAQAFAAETLPLPEDELSEALQSSGMFYLAASAAELSESESAQYLLRVARGGAADEAATLRLELVDITAGYGKNYKVTLPGSGLFGPKVRNADSSRSLMDQIMEEGVQEDLQQDLALAGMSDEQIEAALQEQADGFSEILSEELSAYAEAHPDRYLSPADAEDPAEPAPDGGGDQVLLPGDVPAVEATVLDDPETVRLGDAAEAPAQSALSAAFEAQTGRKDDWKALSSDGSSILDTAPLLMDYSMDAADVIAEGLNSAYLDIPFDAGETERFVAIETIDDGVGCGDTLFLARLIPLSDDVRVSPDNGRCMFTIADDEPWDEPDVFFTQTEFEAAGGFVDVTIRREGVLTAVSSVVLTTSDVTAVGGRDYSEVDASVVFPFGVSERTVHIPVRSTWLNGQAEFLVSLSGPRNCRIGGTDAVYGVIAADSESFRLGAEPASEDAGTELGASTAGIRYGDPLVLSAWDNVKVPYGSGSAWMEGSKCMIKADSNGLADDRAWTYVEWKVYRDILMDGNISAMRGYKASGIEYSGVAVKSTRNSDGLPKSRVVIWTAPDWYNDNYMDASSSMTMGPDEGSWSSTEYRFYWNGSTDRSKQGVSYVQVRNSKADGFWRKHNTLEVQEIRPILRPFVVTAEIANPEVLRYVDNYGNLVDYRDHDSAKSAGELVLGGANTGDNTVIKYVGDYVEVSCSGEYSYIQKIMITNSSGNSYAVTPTYGVGNKTARFALDTSALRYLHNRNLITFTKNPEGEGVLGNLRLEVYMGKIPSTLTLNNSDERGTVRMGFDLHRGLDNGTRRDGDDRDYNRIYRGDYVCFEEALADEYAQSFTASTIRIRRERQSNSGEPGFVRDAYETFDGGQSGWKVTMFNDYAAMTAWPSFDDIDNHVVVRVANEDLALFDTSSGIFTARTIPGQSGYTDYEAVSPADFAAHSFYTLAAEPKDADYVAVWTPGNSRYSYSQNTYFHEGAAESGSNVITLTCRKADAVPYAVTGGAYYAALDLYTGVEGETWMPADGLTVMVTPAAYGISDTTGSFTTIPFRGVNGCYVVMRTEALGNVNYRYAPLTKGAVLETGGITAYAVPLGTFIVPVVNPGVPSINAASLTDNTGVAARTAAVYADALEASQHRYTFTATAVHDGTPYTDTDGTARTEHVKSVEFLAFDGADNTERGALPGTVTMTDNGSGGVTFSLTLGLDMTEDNLNVYRPGDRIYARLTTDRVKGNGVSVDDQGRVLVDAEGRVWEYAEDGSRLPVLDADGEQVIDTALLETVYAPVYTGYDLVSAANYTPPVLNIDILDSSMDSIFEKLPVFGSLNSTLRLSKLAVSEQALPNGGISLCIGYRLNTDRDISVKEFDEEFKGIRDAAKKTMEWGKTVKSPPPMVVGVGGAGVNPFVGLYLDFGISDQEDSKGSLVFIGGGLYVGCTGFFKLVLYFPVGPVPVYFGVDGDLTGYVNLGFQVPDNAKTIEDVAASGVGADTIDLDFKFKAQTGVRVYVGVGLAGTLGVRGGLNFNMSYLYYPSVKNINPNYHEHGFTINLKLQIWLDAFWFSIPISPLSLVDEPFGYARDIRDGVPAVSARFQAEDTGPVTRQAVQPSGWLPGAARLQSTLTESVVTTLIGDNNPYADPQLLDTGDELVLVFLTTEAFFGTAEKGRGDESTLAYSVYPYRQADPQWSEPQRLGDAHTLPTGDFQPDLIAYSDAGEPGAEILVSWVSRIDEPWAADPEDPTTEERLTYLRQMEIYTAVCAVDAGGLTVLNCTRVTDDAFYNSDPQAVSLGAGGRNGVFVYYQAADPSVREIALGDPLYTDFPNEESRQFLANISPGQNGMFQMNKGYDSEAGSWAGSGPFGSFVESPVNGQAHPVLTDFAARSYAAGDGAWVLFAFTQDGDGNISTPYDTDLYLQVYDTVADLYYDPVRLTCDDGIADSRPQFTDSRTGDCYLLWYGAPDTSTEQYADRRKNGEIMMLDIRALFEHGLELDPEHGICRLKTTVLPEELRQEHPAEYGVLESEEDLTPYDYSLPVTPVDMAESGEFEDGPTVTSFMPYLDSEGNLYVVWLQTMTHEEPAGDGSVQTVQTNEIYASARIADPDVPGGTSRWSMPVRLTDDTMFYDEITLVNLYEQDRLIVAANRYEFALDPDDGGMTKPVESADFVAVEFGKSGSLEAVDISYDRELPAAGEEVGVTVTVRNTGLLTAEGGSYTVADTLGTFRLEGGVGRLLPGETEEISFSYTMPDDLSGLDTIGFVTETAETGFPEPRTVIFEDDDAILIGWRAVFGDVQTVQRSDGFHVEYALMNAGNIAMPAGAVQVMAGDSSEMQTVWAAQPFDRGLAPGEEPVSCSMKLEDVADDFAMGFQRGFLAVCDADGTVLEDVGSSRDLVLKLDAPYGITVNGDPDLAVRGIRLKAGETLALRGSYAGASRYPGGTVVFSTTDSGVAAAHDGVLYALAPGETTLLAKAGSLGGLTEIPVTVTEGGAPAPSGGDGGAGYAPSVPAGEHGAVTVSPAAPEAGETVTVTVRPDAGYVLDELTVTDGSGRAVPVTKNDDGTYSFLQPDGYVTIRATFREDPAGSVNPFEDVAEGAYYYDAVLWAVRNGVTQGMTPTRFCPAEACTRAQIVTFLWRAAGRPAPAATECPFTDVAADAYYADAVAWAYEAGVTKGMTATAFGPDETVTRAQAVTFLHRRAGSPAAKDAAPFTDVDRGAYYAGAVDWAYENGVTQGMTATAFGPGGACLRGQIVTFLWRARDLK